MMEMKKKMLMRDKFIMVLISVIILSASISFLPRVNCLITWNHSQHQHHQHIFRHHRQRCPPATNFARAASVVLEATLSTKDGADTSTTTDSNLINLQDAWHLYKQSATEGEGSNDDSNKKDTNHAAVRFIDGSWYHKGHPPNAGRLAFMAGPRLPNSCYWDMQDMVEDTTGDDTTTSSFMMMQPSPALIAAWMDHHQIDPSDHLIVYGCEGSYFAPRVWFTLKYVLGHAKVSVLQASLEDWVAQLANNSENDGMVAAAVDTKLITEPPVTAKELRMKLQTESGTSRYQAKSVPLPPSAVVDSKYILSSFTGDDASDVGDSVAAYSSSAILIDARGSSFARAGHMPGAIHIPYSSLSDPSSSVRLRPRDELIEIFRAKGVDPTDSTRPIVCTCGSGVSACTLYLALLECGRRQSPSPSVVNDSSSSAAVEALNMFVYDGSWKQWKTIDHAPKVLPGGQKTR